MPTGIPYGTTNPRGLEPWSIESTLAPLATGGSQAEAQQMLAMYQQQRQQAGNVYGDDLAAQHQAAMADIQQRMYDTNMKAVSEVGKLPGGAAFLARSPGMASIAGPDAWTGLAQSGATADAAKVFQESGQGYRDFSQGGALFTDINQVPGQAGTTPVITDDDRVRTELIKQQTSLANAAAKANKPELTTVQTTTPLNADGSSHVITSKVPSANAPATIAAHDNISSTIVGNRSGSGSSLQANPDLGTRPSIQPPTSLTPAKTDTPATSATRPPPTGSVQLDTNSAQGKMAQNGAILFADKARSAAAAGDTAAKTMVDDINRGKGSATAYTTAKLPNGQIVVRGASGHEYPITGGPQ